MPKLYSTLQNGKTGKFINLQDKLCYRRGAGDFKTICIGYQIALLKQNKSLTNKIKYMYKYCWKPPQRLGQCVGESLLNKS